MVLRFFGEELGATGPQNLRRHVVQRQAVSDAFRTRLRLVLESFTAKGMRRRAMVVQLNELGIRAAGGGTWSLGQLQRVLDALKVERVEPGSEPVAA